MTSPLPVAFVKFSLVEQCKLKAGVKSDVFSLDKEFDLEK